MIYYCIVHALLKCSVYCSKSGKGKNWRERNIVRHTLEWMSGVFPIRFSMQRVHLYRTWSFDWAAVVVVGTIYHLLLRCHPLYPLIYTQVHFPPAIAGHSRVGRVDCLHLYPGAGARANAAEADMQAGGSRLLCLFFLSLDIQQICRIPKWKLKKKVSWAINYNSSQSHLHRTLKAANWIDSTLQMQAREAIYVDNYFAFTWTVLSSPIQPNFFPQSFSENLTGA